MRKNEENLFREELRAYLKKYLAEGKSVRSLAKAVNCRPQTITRFLDGESKPRIDTCTTLYEFMVNNPIK